MSGVSAKQPLQIASGSAQELEPHKIPIVKMRRSHVADAGTERRQMLVGFEDDIEFRFGLEGGRCLDQRPGDADIDDLDAPVRGQRARQPSNDLKSRLDAAIGHGWIRVSGHRGLIRLASIMAESQPECKHKSVIWFDRRGTACLNTSECKPAAVKNTSKIDSDGLGVV